MGCARGGDPNRFRWKTGKNQRAEAACNTNGGGGVFCARMGRRQRQRQQDGTPPRPRFCGGGTSDTRHGSRGWRYPERGRKHPRRKVSDDREGGGGGWGKKDPKRAVSKTGKALQAREHGHLRQPQHTRRRGRPATAKQGGKRVVRVVRASLRRASFVDVVDARRQFPSRFCCCLMLFFVRHSLMITSSVPCVFSS
jgi:ribosomal protein S21